MPTTIEIQSRFNGPAVSGNGGYAAGALGELISGPSRVSLHAPPPLQTELTITEADGGLMAHDGARLILQASPAPAPEVDVPFVPFETAERAVEKYQGWDDHAAPTCFVCGVDRDDGLRIFPGAVGEAGVVAAPWTPDATVADSSGAVTTRVVWGALDCPGAWAAWESDSEGAPYFPALASMAAEILHPVEVGEPHVVVARYSATEGRKLHTSAALFSADGALKAHAEHLEIKVAGDWARAK